MKDQPIEILELFPALSHILTLRMVKDPDFYALCQDYEICVKALRHWSASREPEADTRRQEYRTLVHELEQEIAHNLESSDP